MTMPPNEILKNVDDISLIRDVKSNGNNESICELIRRHSPLCVKVYNTYKSECFTSGSFDFQVRDKDRIIYESAKTFDESKQIKFSTWLAHNMRYRCLTYKQKIREEMATQYPEDVIEDICAKPRNSEKVLEQVVDLLDKHPDKRIKEIFILRYSEDGMKLKWREIAEVLGLSRQMVTILHDHGKRFLLHNFPKEFNLVTTVSETDNEN